MQIRVEENFDMVKIKRLQNLLMVIHMVRHALERVRKGALGTNGLILAGLIFAWINILKFRSFCGKSTKFVLAF